MDALRLDGRPYADAVKAELRESVKAIGGRPVLKIFMVGNNPRSEAYVNKKVEAAAEVGITCEVERFQPDVTTRELENRVIGCGGDCRTDGLIIQLPLPSHIDLAKVSSSIDPRQDLDCFTPVNQGKLLLGWPEFIPATPLGIIELMRRAGYTTQGKLVTIVNHSSIIGKPLAAALLLPGEMGDATVTVAHEKTPDLRSACAKADVLISGAGVPGLITRDHVKPGAVVIDVGTTPLGPRLVGDVDFGPVSEIAAAVTPVPFGVGPMTVAMLLWNTVKACRLQQKTRVA